MSPAPDWGAIRSRGSDERGAFMVIWALAVVAVVTMAAIAIDLSSLRTDRRSDRLAADAAVTAAVASLDTTAASRLAACEQAWDYAANNLGFPSQVSRASTVCGGFTGTCSDTSYVAGTTNATVTGDTGTTAGSTSPQSLGNFTVTVVTPVQDTDVLPNGSPWMRADAISGGIAQGVSSTAGGTDNASSDGTPCQRLGISIKYTRAPFFGAVTGSGARSTIVHSVARRLISSEQVPVNVVLLDPHDCHVMEQKQAAGGITVSDTNTGTGHPVFGAAVLISDATTNGGHGDCSGTTTHSDYVVDAQATPGLLINPGDLYIKAFSGSTCGSSHACNDAQIGTNIQIEHTYNSGSFSEPKPLSVAVDRSVVDYLFNCRANYTTGLSMAQPMNPPRSNTPLSPCTNAPGDYVNQYVKAIATDNALSPSGVSATTTCPTGGTASAPTVLTGDYDFKCNFSSNGNIANIVIHGNAIFEPPNNKFNPSGITVDGNATIKASGGFKPAGMFSIGGNAYFVGTQVLLDNAGTLQVCSDTTACTTGVSGGVSTDNSYATNASSCTTGSGFLATLDACAAKAGKDFHTVYLDSGSSIAPQGGTVVFDHTFVYAAYDRSNPTNGADIALGGGSGITWSPPSTGPFVENNAQGLPSAVSFWSDVVGSDVLSGTTCPASCTHVQQLSGSGAIQLNGVFFTPGVIWNLGGGGTAGNGETAQFVAYELLQSGSSTFNLTPSSNFIDFPVGGGPALIR